MANKNNPRGARPLDTLVATDFNEKVHKYIIPSTDTDNFFINDFVRLVNNAINGIPIIEKGPVDKAVVGVIASLEQNVPATDVPYRKGGQQQIAYVSDDPQLIIDIQANGVISETDIGKFADIVLGSGDIYNGLSTTQLDVTTISANEGLLKILSIVETPVNEMGQYVKLRCKINKHQYNGVSPEGTMDHAALFNLNYDAANHGSGYTGFQRGTTLSAIDPTNTDDVSKGYVQGDLWLNTATQSQFVCMDNTLNAAVWATHGPDIWKRLGTTISPLFTGDLLDMTPGGIKTSGNIEGGTINCIGKLTVGGIIDPTGMAYDPQATPPDTSDGVQYYDSGNDSFEFREDGEWRTLGYSDIWERVVTTVNLRNAGDTVQFDGTGGIKFDLGGQVITYFDTDGTLAADSDNRVPTQKAVKTYVDSAPVIGSLWTTVGPVGSGAVYNSIEDARAAGYFDILIVKDFTETKDVALNDGVMQITISEQLDMDNFVFNLTTGSIKVVGGRLKAAYTSSDHKIFAGGSSGNVYLDHVEIDLTGSSGANAGITTQTSGTLQVNDCNILLADSAESGFEGASTKSMICNCIFTGGGTSCDKPIDRAQDCTISNCTFDGTFKTNGTLIQIQTQKCVLDNINYLGAAENIINIDINENLLSNISGALTIDLNSSSNNVITNCSVSGIKNSVGSRYNYFANIFINNFNTIVNGDDYRFVNCYFEEDVTLNGSNNTLLSCIILGTYTDNGTFNSYINEVSDDGTFSSATDVQLATALAIKTYVDNKHGDPEQEVLPVTTPGQTSFTLSHTPKAQKSFFLYVNGQLRRYGASYDYTFSGTTLTWNDPGGFTLDTTDELIAGYDY